MAARTSGIAVDAGPGPDAERAEPSGTQAIDRAMSVLFAFGIRPVWRVADLAAHVGINKSTVYRLLQALAAAGLVRRDDEFGTFRLGSSVLDLASAFLSNYDIPGTARTFLKELAETTGESVTLAIIDGTDAISIEQIRGTRTPQMVSNLGRRVPLYCSSSGRALLLDHSEAALDDVLERSAIRALTRNTLIAPAAIAAQIEASRARGWAMNDEETEVGLRAVAAPVRDHQSGIVAAISVSAPTFRLARNEVESLAISVTGAAKAVSDALGYRNRDAPSPVERRRRS